MLPFPASRLSPTVASAVRRSRFRSLGSPRSLPPGFPCARPRFRYSASLFVSFRPASLRSHSCSTSACLLSGFFRPLIPGLFPFRLASFRPLSASLLSYSAFSLFLSASSLTRLAPARSVPLRFFRHAGLLFLPPCFRMVSVRFRLLSSLPRSLSSFPVHLPQLTSRCWPYFLLPLVRFFLRPSSFLVSVPFRSLPLQALTTQVPVSSFQLSRSSASQWLSCSPPPLSLPRSPRSLPPDLSFVPSRFPYSALLHVSFRPSLLRSRSRSTGDPLSVLPSGADA